MFRIAIGLIALSLLLSCATTSQVPAAARSEPPRSGRQAARRDQLR